jgi:hypothetical protein
MSLEVCCLPGALDEVVKSGMTLMAARAEFGYHDLQRRA